MTRRSLLHTLLALPVVGPIVVGRAVSGDKIPNCLDCRFYRAPGGACTHDSAISETLYHMGRPEVVYYPARIQRSSKALKGDCGPLGRFFKPFEPDG